MGFFSLFKACFLKLYGVFLDSDIADLGKQLPEKEPAILVINHTTGSDPIVLQATLDLRIFFLITGARYKNRFTRYFFNNVTDCIPVYMGVRAENLSSMKRIFKLLSEKRVIGIFPEGDYRKRLKVRKVFNGAAFIAYKSQVPIYPVYIHNISEGLNPKSRFHRSDVFEGILTLFSNLFRYIQVFIGDPVYANKPEGISDTAFFNQISARISAELDGLKEIAENQNREAEVKVTG
ncbi:MAG: 1-acyl-sn-glycerol-3-phosphate acyltransferase [Actinobacteria bacterium]|nr:1-acyl-sn-glycerol-3-phosphate acyltransferase [Actinomycetota bacterium]